MLSDLTNTCSGCRNNSTKDILMPEHNFERFTESIAKTFAESTADRSTESIANSFSESIANSFTECFTYKS